jgi:putative pyruvate formate lyase activating enzyme
MSFTRCTTCARRCGADRTRASAKPGCRVGRLARIAELGPGRLAFAGCSLACLFCPTPAANRDGQGGEVDAAGLAAILLDQQATGAAQLDLVHPAHVAEQLAEALALLPGLTLPLAWVSTAFDGPEALAVLAGRIASFRPEIKFGCDRVARQLAGISGYGAASRTAVAAMLAQVGPMAPTDPTTGVLVRHRVLPDGLAGTRDALGWLPAGTPVQILADYKPAHRASQHPRLKQPATPQEVAEAKVIVAELGLAPWP